MRYSGITGSKGTVTGRARVLTKVEDIALVEQGDILICKMTTPEWVPALHKVAALVTEEGGSLCHANIVARAFGLPCIVGAAGVMGIKDGEQVTVAALGGQDGYVSVIEKVALDTAEDKAKLWAKAKGMGADLKEEEELAHFRELNKLERANA